MKKLILISYLLTMAMTTIAQQSDFPKLSGPYLGQTESGDEAKLFLPEIFKNIHSSPAFSPDGKQVFWRSMDQKSLLFMQEINGVWTAPDFVPFKSKFYRQDVPFFSPDGKRIYFITTKPQRWYQLWSGEAIWYVEKEKDGWSNPKQVSKEINKIYTHWQFSVSANGNIYLNGKDGDKWFIYISELKEGKYTKPAKIETPLCLAEGQSSYFFPFISPDESFLIFSRRVDGNNPDLFISYRKEDGTWTEAVNLGDRINSKGLEICPVVTPDGKYLFYMRRDCVMWVSAKIIEDLKPKELK
ncbi:MAG: hypothetical protein KKG99_13035 [Bacteroidetes bacterium]|nr:hypothetical protein [Bacteroidota bacterium]